MAVHLADVPVRPIVKWAGGKGRLLPALRAALPARWSGRYFEPFCGGAALFFDQRPSRAVLGDINARLMNLYTQVRRDHRAVFAALEQLARVRAERADVASHYYAVRAEFNDEAPVGVVQAARFLYLNAGGYNGLYRENRAGRYNVPAGRPAKRAAPLAGPAIAERLRLAADALARAELVTGHYRRTLEAARCGDVVYLDPPYMPLRQSGFSAYAAAGFGPCDHRELAALAHDLVARGCHVVASNHDLPAVRGLYQGFRCRRASVVRAVSCGRRRRAPELVLVASAGASLR